MYYFIVNPASRSHHGIKVWNKVKAYLENEAVEYKVYFSKRPGHVQELMYDICNEHINDEARPNIIILGGDGTFNEAIQGVISFEKINIGYIPTGSSNDFARALGYSDDPVESLKRIIDCEEPIKHDIGTLKYESISDERSRLTSGDVSKTRYFNVSCGIGFDAAICEEALKSKAKDILNKIGLGKLIYIFIAIRQIFSSKFANALLTLDNGRVVQINKCRFIVGMNTCYEGGGYKFCPDAEPTDGCIDICTVGEISPFGFFLALPGAMKGTHVKNKRINIYRVKSFEIKTDSPLWVHTDGEVHAKTDHIKVGLNKVSMNFLY